MRCTTTAASCTTSAPTRASRRTSMPIARPSARRARSWPASSSRRRRCRPSSGRPPAGSEASATCDGGLRTVARRAAARSRLRRLRRRPSLLDPPRRMPLRRRKRWPSARCRVAGADRDRASRGDADRDRGRVLRRGPAPEGARLRRRRGGARGRTLGRREARSRALLSRLQPLHERVHVLDRDHRGRRSPRAPLVARAVLPLGQHDAPPGRRPARRRPRRQGRSRAREARIALAAGPVPRSSGVGRPAALGAPHQRAPRRGARAERPHLGLDGRGPPHPRGRPRRRRLHGQAHAALAGRRRRGGGVALRDAASGARLRRPAAPEEGRGQLGPAPHERDRLDAIARARREEPALCRRQRARLHAAPGRDRDDRLEGTEGRLALGPGRAVGPARRAGAAQRPHPPLRQRHRAEMVARDRARPDRGADRVGVEGGRPEELLHARARLEPAPPERQHPDRRIRRRARARGRRGRRGRLGVPEPDAARGKAGRDRPHASARVPARRSAARRRGSAASRERLDDAHGIGSRSVTEPGARRARASAKGGGRSTATWAAALVLVLCATIPWLVQRHWDAKPDAATYLLAARSLARGEGYRVMGEPYTLRPPGFSLALAPIVAWRGIDFEALNLAGEAFGVAAVALFFLLLAPRVGNECALAAALALELQPGFQQLCNQVLSDVPGLALALLALLAIRWSGRRPSIARDVVAGAAIALATWVRTANVLLVPALALERLLAPASESRPHAAAHGRERGGMRERLRHATVAGAIALAAYLPWALQPPSGGGYA